jgi:hypothetical protein
MSVVAVVTLAWARPPMPAPADAPAEFALALLTLFYGTRSPRPSCCCRSWAPDEQRGGPSI